MVRDRSPIEWTDATWNPVHGCSIVSPGCENCYAASISHRYGYTSKPWTAANAGENVRLHPERLAQPLKWKAPRRIFVNSMSDLFHEMVPDSFIDKVFAVMAKAKQHTFQVLTKRPRRMHEYLTKRLAAECRHAYLKQACADLTVLSQEKIAWPLANVWLGVSVEDQRRAGERIPLLLETPAVVRFVSAEPLLGPLNLSSYLATLDWLIDGGESGPGRRPADADWFRSLRDQCSIAGVSYFHKQGNSFRPGQDRLLDGRAWDEYPPKLAAR